MSINQIEKIDTPKNSNDLIILGKLAWERLNPSNWPFDIKKLPSGSFLVGGSVRDALLNELDKKLDLDFVIPLLTYETAKEISEDIAAKLIILDEDRCIFRLVISSWTIDIARQIGTSLFDDLNRRDFSINSIALKIEGDHQLIDLFNGIRDLNNKYLRPISKNNLIDDPLRILRCFRFISEYNFTIDQDTQNFCKNKSFLLTEISPERINYEIKKLICGKYAENSIKLIHKLNILQPWINKSKVFINYCDQNYLNRSLFEEELLNALPYARLFNLLSTEGLKNLKFSKKEIKICELLRKWQSRNNGSSFSNLTENELFELHEEMENFLPIIILGLAKKDQEIWMRRWNDLQDPLFHPTSPLDGNYLKKHLRISDGPSLGMIIKRLKIEKAFGRLQNKYQALDLAQKLWKQKQPFL